MGIPGTPNPLLMRRAAAAGDDAYQIERSLRFNKSDTPVLQRLFGLGNTRTWTWAGWVKRSTLGVQHNLFSAFGGDSNNQGYLVLESDDMIAFDQRIGGTWSNSTKTNRKLIDSSAWFHITFVFDSTNTVEADRIRLFINGERYTGTWNDAPNCTQNLEGKYNSAMWHEIGKGQGNSNHMDGYLADVHFIDGLALSPAAFGSFDSADNWNPKAFALPAPNNGTTWSSSVTTESGSFHTNGPATNLFDGAITTQVFDSNAGGWEKFSPSGGISYNQSVEVYRGNTANSTTSNSISDFSITDDDGSVITKSFGNATGVWDTLVEGKGKFTEIKCDPESGDWGYWGGIKVDGVILVDGQTDPTTRTNPNNNTNWASKVSFNNGTWNANSGALSFDGSTATNNYATVTKASGGWATFPLADFAGDNKTITVTAEQTILTLTHAGGTSSFTPSNTSNVTHTFPTVTLNSSSTIKFEGLNNDSVWVLCAIKVNGHTLINSSVDNSFHLKFNDASRNSSLGKDSFRGKIADATGGLPFYETTDDYGETKASSGTLYRSDSTAGTTDGAGLIFAMPGDVLTDEHDHVNTGSSAHTVTNGGVAVRTAESRFYGSSLDFGENGNANTYLTLPEHADFQFGTGDFCIEMWVYYQKTTRETYSLWGQKNNPEDGVMFRIDGYGEVLKAFFTWAGGGELSCNHTFRNKWTHVALTRASGTFRLFVNGVEGAQASNTYDMDGSVAPRIGSNVPNGSTEYFAGKLQDIRVYKGNAKYTSNFTVPHRNDFVVSNLAAVDPEVTVANTDAKTKPIFQTTGSQGATKNSPTAYNTDAYKSLLVFAVPGDTIADVSHVSDLRNSGSAVSITNRNSVDLLTTQSRFYGTSMYFDGNDATNDGTGDAIHIDTSNVTIGTGEFTVEFWAKPDSIFNNFVMFDCRHGSNNWPTNDDGFTIQSNAAGRIWSDGMTGGGAGGLFNSGDGVFKAGEWQHLAATRDSSNTMRFFVNGKVVSSATSQTWDFDQTRMCWGNSASFGEGYKGFIQDIRVYKGSGACKYTADFTVPRFGEPEGIDSLTDTPTNYGTDSNPPTGAEVRGNYPTFNPLIPQPTGGSLSQGNLTIETTSSGELKGYSTMAIPASTGKWYFEITVETKGNDCQHYLYRTDTTTAGASLNFRSGASGDVFGYAIDQTAGTWVRYKNGSSDTNGTHDEEYDWLVRVYDYQSSAKHHINFGQRAFKHTAPSGYKALCTQNLDDFSSGTSLNDPKYFFDINLYTGAGTGNTTTFSGMKFGPDLIWGKARSYADPPGLCDVVRGVSALLVPSGYGGPSTTSGSHVTAFNSDGYTLGNGVNFNGSSTTYVNWCWDVGTSAATVNTNGSLDPSNAWVNTTSGINILKYTGNGSDPTTVGHNLGAKPDLIIIKALANNYNWEVYASPIGAEYNLALNTNGDKYDSSERWNDTEPTADVFTLGDYANVNENGVVFMAYLFTSIPGYSMIGSYEGNGSSTGPFVYTGFKVRYILTKNVDTDSNWRITDTDRADIPFANPQDQKLYTDGDWVEGSGDEIWLMSNGFKILDSDDGFNKNGDTFLFMAFAEHPFKTARAR